MTFNKIKYIDTIAVIGVCILAAIYFYIGYFFDRTNFWTLLVLWCVLFGLFWKVLESFKPRNNILIGISILFRALLIISIPNLSQDFYRFIWDGRMLLEGISPYLSLPQDWIDSGNLPISQAQELYDGMGTLNGSHYTNYPPISQFCYTIAALLSPNSILGAVIVLRLILIIADIGIYVIGSKLLTAYDLPRYRIYWYLLNPFIILELTGNLHFEGVMIFFILFSLYLLHRREVFWSAVCLGLAVSVKLIPLLFLPLMLQHLGYWNQKKNDKFSFAKPVFYYLIVGATVILSFAPFFSAAFINNFIQTIGLWFQNFEFNASIYYIIRWIGYQIVGWNTIGSVGKILPLVVILILLVLALFRKNRSILELFSVLVIGICTYYFLSTTVHPWYISVPLALSIFTKYKFPLIWSFVIILSYSAYKEIDFKENLWMVALEYTLVFSMFFYEVILEKKITKLQTADTEK